MYAAYLYKIKPHSGCTSLSFSDFLPLFLQYIRSLLTQVVEIRLKEKIRLTYILPVNKPGLLVLDNLIPF